MIPDDLVTAERLGSVLLVTFNRPERLNAWTDPMEDAYFGILREADRDREVRVIVVTGRGRGFCAGADIDLLAEAASGGPDGSERERHYPLQVRKPMIAAINGAAAGLGLMQALFCDVRFVTPEAKLTTAFARRGLTAEYASAWLLSDIVGRGRAADLLLSGRVINGLEAFRMGLADHLASSSELVDQSIEYAQDLATNCSPWSMYQIKAQLRRAEGTLADSMVDARERMQRSFRYPDSSEGVASFLERRPPAWLRFD